MKPLRSSYPVGHLLNPATRYVPSHATDVRETFRRAEKRQQRAGYVAHDSRDQIERENTK